MADIQSAAQWLGRLLIEEAKYLSEVEGKVHELQDELYWMHCFLREADGSQHDSVMARRWVSQIREFTYEAEDTIEKFLVRVVTDRRRRVDFMQWVKKYLKFFWEARLVHRIGSDINSLKNKISFLTSKLQTYNIQLKLEASSSSWLLRKKYNFISYEEKTMIGRKDDLEELVGILLKSGTEGRSATVSICGVGGIGKTFLAKKIFHDKDIRKHFDAFAWAYVSEPCQSSAVHQDLLSSLTSKSQEQISQMIDSELKDELCKVQCKDRCLIVLDGLNEEEYWNRLKYSFPFANCNYKSTLVITNRRKEVAEHVCNDAFIHPLKALHDSDTCMQLLETIIKDRIGFPETDKQRLYELKVKMVKFCEGLPLAISVLAGVLATKKTLEEWEKVHKYIDSFSANDQQTDHKFQNWKRILELGYYELPYQLKPSFLYLGYFLTNLEIPTNKIIRLWEAEGLVAFDDLAEMSGYTLESVAESCLGELVERSLVQVGSRGLTGKAKTCLIHDLMRDLCMSKASQGNMLSIVPLGAPAKNQHSSGQSSRKHSKSAQKKFRRLAIYYSDTSAKFPSDYRHAKNIRSLLFFNTLTGKEFLIPLESILGEAFENYKLLRVLDIENIDAHKLPKELGFLFHLRYLSIRGSWVTKLPSTIGNLKCLQTLDLRVLSFVHLRIPDVICSMVRLIHLYLPSKEFILRDKAKNLQLKDLKFLETLSNFSNNCKADDVKDLINLRRFSSCGYLDNGESIAPLLDSPSSKLEHLEHVSLSLDSAILKEHPDTLAKCSKLRKLWLKGEIAESFHLENLPKKLIHITLNNSRLKSDPMQALGKLPELKKLSLKNAAYLGTTLTCSENDFPDLRYLTLNDLGELQEWTIEGKAMPQLCRLKIHSCQKLKMIPEGLKSIENLKELSISYMPWSFFDRLQPNEIKSMSWTHFDKVKYVPCFRVHHVLDLNSIDVEDEMEDELESVHD